MPLLTLLFCVLEEVLDGHEPLLIRLAGRSQHHPERLQVWHPLGQPVWQLPSKQPPLLRWFPLGPFPPEGCLLPAPGRSFQLSLWISTGFLGELATAGSNSDVQSRKQSHREEESHCAVLEPVSSVLTRLGSPSVEASAASSSALGSGTSCRRGSRSCGRAGPWSPLAAARTAALRLPDSSGTAAALALRSFVVGFLDASEADSAANASVWLLCLNPAVTQAVTSVLLSSSGIGQFGRHSVTPNTNLSNDAGAVEHYQKGSQSNDLPAEAATAAGAFQKAALRTALWTCPAQQLAQLQTACPPVWCVEQQHLMSKRYPKKGFVAQFVWPGHSAVSIQKRCSCSAQAEGICLLNNYAHQVLNCQCNTRTIGLQTPLLLEHACTLDCTKSVLQSANARPTEDRSGMNLLKSAGHKSLFHCILHCSRFADACIL